MAKCDNIDTVDLGLVDVINTVLPFEKHLLGMNYCGPRTNLKKKLLPDGITPRKEYLPIDRVDKIALEHDLHNNMHSDLRHRLDADEKMISELKNIENVTCRERIERIIVLPIMTIKRFFGNIYLKLFGQD